VFVLNESNKKIGTVLLISSGKGGVGKSTVASNLACAFKALGKSVGILDADIYGPSQFQMFGIIQYEKNTSSKMHPTIAHDIEVMSSASLKKDHDAPMAWRGPMASLVLNSMIKTTQWTKDLDVLVVDMPPGTGDIQLEIIKQYPNAKAVIVTTPQEVALIDTKKGIEMFINNSIEILGIVENMNHYICKSCGSIESIFGDSKVKDTVAKYNIDVLGQIPIVRDVAVQGDAGMPITLNQPDSIVAQCYVNIANAIKFDSDTAQS
jgi:ATP-binding protein involved in chromosome partitioning